MNFAQSRAIVTFAGLVHVVEFGSIVYVHEEQFRLGDILSMRVDQFTRVVTYAINAVVIYSSPVLYDTDEHAAIPPEALKRVREEQCQRERSADDDFFENVTELDL